ncbi:MAG: SDR family oxidoreductase [Halodesulfurarchaeum sp.]|nr:SDR family oxidoreductase [Halodesulfurarchaeum sp.]
MIRHDHCPGRLAEKVIVISGSTQGIGLGMAKRFSAEGASVVINDHGANDGETIAEAVAQEGGEAIYVQADAGKPEEIDHLIEKTVEEFGRIDVLVNNVTNSVSGPFEERTLEEWDSVMDVALKSYWYYTKQALPHMPEGSSVINISSVHAIQTDPECFPYNVANSGINGLTRALSIELGVHGIRVNTIMPGKILTEALSDHDYEDGTWEDHEQDPFPAHRHDPDSKKSIERQNTELDPIGRFGTPADIAGLAAYLAADESSLMTGTAIPVDGGRTTTLRDHDYAQWLRERSE